MCKFFRIILVLGVLDVVFQMRLSSLLQRINIPDCDERPAEMMFFVSYRPAKVLRWLSRDSVHFLARRLGVW